MGFRGMDRHIGVPQTTLSQRVIRIEGVECLQLLSGNAFRVIRIEAEDGNDYLLLRSLAGPPSLKIWLKIQAD